MGRFSCPGVVLYAAAFLALAQASRGRGDSPETAVAAAKQILAKAAELDEASREQVERIVADLEASPEVRVPYHRFSPERRAAFQRLIEDWGRVFPEIVAEWELGESEREWYFAELECDVKRLMISPVFDQGDDLGARQFEELKRFVIQNYVQRCLAVLSKSDRASIQSGMEVRLAATYRDPRQPAADLTPLFKYPLSAETVVQLKRELSEQIEKDRRFTRWLDDYKATSGVDQRLGPDNADALACSASLSTALARIDRAFCDAVPSPLLQQWGRVQRDCTPGEANGEGKLIRPPESENGQSGHTRSFREPIFAGCSPRRIRVWDHSTCRVGIPNRQAVLEALRRNNPQLAGDVIRRNCRMVVTRTRDRTDPVRMYPLIGPAKRHNLHFACAFYEGDSRLPYAIVEFYANHLDLTGKPEEWFPNDHPWIVANDGPSGTLRVPGPVVSPKTPDGGGFFAVSRRRVPASQEAGEGSTGVIRCGHLSVDRVVRLVRAELGMGAGRLDRRGRGT